MNTIMDSEKGFTLVEVLITITLVFLIGAAIVNIDFASRIGFIQAGNKSKVSNEARFAMKHITRNLRLANQAKVIAGGTRITLRLDHDLSTNTPLNTPSDFTDDYECRYEYQAGPHKIRYAYKKVLAGWGGFLGKILLTRVLPEVPGQMLLPAILISWAALVLCRL